MADSGRLVRQWKLVRMLAARRHGVSLQEMADEIGVTVRTIYRDLHCLEEAGFPLQQKEHPHGLKTWKLASGNGQPPLAFCWDELAALYLGRRFLEPLAGTVFDAAARSALEKIRAELSSSAVRYLEKLARSVHHTTFGGGDYRDKNDILETLRTCIEDRHICLLTYQPLRATEPVEYEAYPLGLAFHHNALYLVAFSVDRRAKRHFKLDRIETATDQKLIFEPPPEIAGFTLDDHFAHALAIYERPGDPIPVRIRFTAAVARTIKESRLHPSQKLTTQRDGSLLVELSLSALEEVKSWVLSFGAKAEVLAPEELRRDVQEELRTAMAAYDGEETSRRAGRGK